MQNLINHIVFVVDKSGSMVPLSNKVIQVFDATVSNLARRSTEFDQETRASVYLFNTNTSNIFYDKDVLRLPSLKGLYRAEGGTALIDATILSINDLEKTAQLYGDHAFLIYVLTDGEENSSRNRAYNLSSRIKALPDNWTLACLVPDSRNVDEAKRFGFLSENISIWDVSEKGIENVGSFIQQTTDNFMRGRSQGIRGTKSLFKLNTNISTRQVKQNLDALRINEYELLNVHRDSEIRPFVESWKIPYRKGAAYYQLVKPETVQNHKQICIQNKTDGRVYTGPNARKLLGLPDYEIKVSPADYSNYEIFIQSTSVNRRLNKGTKLIVIK